jgi:acylphosphatase
MKVHVNINISGRVQRVGFRYHTMKNAHALGLTGFVRNNADGSVYAEAEGEESAVEKFTDWCRTGPSMAVVEDLRVEKGQIMDYTSFEIRGY